MTAAIIYEAPAWLTFDEFAAAFADCCAQWDIRRSDNVCDCDCAACNCAPNCGCNMPRIANTEEDE